MATKKTSKKSVSKSKSAKSKFSAKSTSAKKTSKSTGSKTKSSNNNSKINNSKITFEVLKPKDAHHKHYFILKSGIPLRNLKELAHSLENMSDDIFSHHVNDERNDFAKWTEEILEEEELAKEMKEINNTIEMELKVLRHLVKKYV